MEKGKVEESDVMSFKLDKNIEFKLSLLHYIAGQFAFFDIDEVYNDLKAPVRHFTISFSPTEDIIISIMEKHEKMA
jgi:hypothetical protein